MVETATLVIGADTSGVRRAESDLDKLNRTGKKSTPILDSIFEQFRKIQQKAAPAVKKVSDGVDKVTKSFRVQKGAVQQTAFQLQDLTVQLEGGVAASRALAQQLPQALGVFGAGGAIAGVVASFVSIGLADLIDGLFDTEDAAKLLADEMEKLDAIMKINVDGTIELSDQYEKLARVSNDVAQTQLKLAGIQAKSAQQSAIKLLIKDIDELNLSTTRAGKLIGVGGLADELGITDTEAQKLSRTVKTLIRKQDQESVEALDALISDLAANSEEASDKLVTIAGKVNVTSESFRDLEKAARSAKDEIRAVGDTVEDNPFYADREGDFQRQVDEITRQIEQEENLAKRKLDRERALTQKLVTEDEVRRARLIKNRKRQAEQEKALNDQRFQGTIGFIESTSGAIEAGAKEGSIVAKLAFAAQQSADIARTISATEAAAMQAVALAGGNPAAGAPIKALGYTAAGIIAGQTVASFEGGGMTPSGPRVGVVDGKGGKFAVVHPDEKITDMKKGGGGSITINNYGNDNVSARYVTAKDVEVIIGGMAGNQNSPMHKNLRRTSNLRPIGSS